MKAILEFNLDEPYDAEKFEQCKNGPNLKMQIDEFSQWLRKLSKHHEREKWPDIEAVREKLWEFLRDD